MFEQNINWTTIWTDQTRNLTDNVKLAEFNYKILHLILPSGKLLKRWKLSDTDLCLVCHVIDDYEHMFMSCIRVKNMWQKISYIFKYAFKINVHISFETLILGQQINACNKKFIKFVNIIVTIAKYTIFKIWCKHRSDERALNNINVFNSFKTDMKFYLQIEITRNGSHIELSRLFIDNM